MYDVIVIGAGPAGLAAGLYASRAKLKTLIIEKGLEGGQIVNTMDVENYPGALEGETGMELAMRMAKQTKDFGAEFAMDEIVEAHLDGQEKVLVGKSNTYKAKTVIIATGASPRKMDVPGEETFASRGVSYCATCDAAFYQDADVFVVGGGDAAVEEAMFITRFARKVTVIHRRDALRAAKSIQEKAFANDKIEFLWDTVVKEVRGDKFAEELVVENVKTHEETVLSSGTELKNIGIFAFIGYTPHAEIFAEEVKTEGGYILTDETMATNVPGVFAAGDIRVKGHRQVVTAVSDGAIAAMNAERYLEG